MTPGFAPEGSDGAAPEGGGSSGGGPADAHVPPEVDQALRGLSSAYAEAVDRRDGEALASLFHPEGMLVVPRYPDELAPVVIRRGEAELRTVPDGLRRFVRTFHRTTDHVFTSGGEGGPSGPPGSVLGRVRCVAHHLRSDGPAGSGPPFVDTVWYLRYVDDYRRDGARWCFWRRELHLEWVEEHPVAAMGPSGG